MRFAADGHLRYHDTHILRAYGSMMAYGWENWRYYGRSTKKTRVSVVPWMMVKLLMPI